MCNIIVVKQPKKYFFLLHFQVRDEYRTDFDPGRGGFGKQGQQSSGVISGPPVAYSKRWHMLCMQFFDSETKMCSFFSFSACEKY